MAIIPNEVYDFDQSWTPGFVARINYIANFIVDPCEADVWLYVELAAQPAGNLAANIVSLDPVDVAKNIIQPRNAAAHRRSQKRGARRKRLPFTLDLEDSVADKVKRNSRMTREVWRGKKAFFAIAAGRLERLVWWWFLLDLYTEFLYDWMSAIVSSEQCQANTYGRARLTDGSYNDLGASVDQIFPLVGSRSQTFPAYLNIASTGNVRNGFQVMFSANVYANDFGQVEATLTLQFIGAKGTVILDQQTISIAPFDSDEILLSGTAPYEGRVQVVYNKSRSWAVWTQIRLMNVGQPKNIFR